MTEGNWKGSSVLKGNEQVLDIGCGLGKTTIGVAKHLTTGIAVGIDIWRTVEVPGNSAERAYEKARIAETHRRNERA